MAKKKNNSRLGTVLNERNVVTNKSYQKEDIGSPLARKPAAPAAGYAERETSTPLRRRVSTVREDTTNEMLEEIEMAEQYETEKREHRSNIRHRVFNIVMALLSFYMVFLIYGVVTTQYAYNNEGKVKAEKMSVSDIKEKKEFEKILAQYQNARALYEQILMFDKRLELDSTQAMSIATEYEGISDDIESLYTKVSSITVDAKYSQLKNMLLVWLKGDDAQEVPNGLFMYVTYMSAAISQNDSENADAAVQAKDNVYTSFSVITSDLVALGENIKGVDMTEERKWSPESYVDEQVNGKKDEK